MTISIVIQNIIWLSYCYHFLRGPNTCTKVSLCKSRHGYHTHALLNLAQKKYCENYRKTRSGLGLTFPCSIYNLIIACLDKKTPHFPSRLMENEHLRNLLTCASLIAAAIEKYWYDEKLFYFLKRRETISIGHVSFISIFETNFDPGNEISSCIELRRY